MKLNISRKILIFIFVLVILTACSSKTQKESETFLNTTDDETFLWICIEFHLLRYDDEGSWLASDKDITTAKDISQTGMYIYIVSECWDTFDKFYHEDTEGYGVYRIPIDDYQEYIDKYFDNYTVEPDKIYYDVYDTESDELVFGAAPSPSTGFPEIAEKKAVDDDTIEIKVNYYDRIEDSDSDVIIETEIITLKIVDGDYKFVSLTIE